MDDARLLQEYAQTGSDAIFRALVERYATLVYRCALRQVRRADMAEDVRQAVFIVLAKRVPLLHTSNNLAGWLIKVTRHASLDALKVASRRRVHEQAAARIAPYLTDESAPFPEDELLAELDAALLKLTEEDRNAIALRYLQGLSFLEVAEELKITSDAAKKRVTRAVGRLRLLLSGATGAIALAGLEARLEAIQLTAVPSLPQAPSAFAIQLAQRVFARGTISRLRWKAAAFAVVVGIVLMFWKVSPANAPQAIAAKPVAPTAWRPPVDPSLRGFPISTGWPMALPGVVATTPVPADLDGDGKLEVIVTSLARDQYFRTPQVHPQRSPHALLFAFRVDGTVMPGWPVRLSSYDAAPGTAVPDQFHEWASSPTVVDVGRDGREEIVIISNDHRALLIGGDAKARVLSEGLNPWDNVAVADVNGDRTAEIVLGPFGVQSDGKELPYLHRTGFPTARAPAIGDLDGDGQADTIYLAQTARRETRLLAFNALGKALPDWDRPQTMRCLFQPVLGDIDGDSRLEMSILDTRTGNLLLWRHDGSGVAGTHHADGIEGIFKTNVRGEASPTMADLDGDGSDEIIVFSNDTRHLCAWHGDGKGFLNAGDGRIVALPEARCWGGVTVGDLGADGEMDLFVATYWIRLRKDKSVSVTNMLPETAATTTQCSITDLDGDGTAEILFGLVDGRVFVYQTRKTFSPLLIAWPTASGGYQHTGISPLRVPGH